MDNLMTHDKTTFRDLMSEYYGMTAQATSPCTGFILITYSALFWKLLSIEKERQARQCHTEDYFLK
jgi:hypothetical protein